MKLPVPAPRTGASGAFFEYERRVLVVPTTMGVHEAPYCRLSKPWKDAVDIEEYVYEDYLTNIVERGI